MNSEQLGLRLRREREKCGYTQESLASKLGIQRLTQAAYERGLREPKVGYLHDISALGLDAIFILFGPETPDPGPDSRAVDEATKLALKHLLKFFQVNPQELAKFDIDQVSKSFNMLLGQAMELSQQDKSSTNSDAA